VDQIQNGLRPEFLQQLFHPTAIGQSHRQQLEVLVQTHPQCSIFRLLLAKSLQHADAETAEKALQSAAVYAANREILFWLIRQPELIVKPKLEKFYPFVPTVLVDADASFIDPKPAEIEDEEAVFVEDVPAEEITDASFIDPKPAEIKDEEAVFVGNIPAEKITDASFINPKPAEIEDEEAVFAEDIPAEKITDASFINPKPAEIEDEEVVFVEDIPAEKITDASFIDLKPAEIEDEKAVFVEDIPAEKKTDASFIDPNLEETIAAENDFRVEDVAQTFINEADDQVVFSAEKTILASEENLNQPENLVSQEIDEEVYEEIMAIEDFDFKVIKEASAKTDQPKPETTGPEIISAESTSQPAQDEAEKAMLNNIASIDYFTFNNKFGQNQTLKTAIGPAENVDNQPNVIEFKEDFVKPGPAVEEEQETVSKYHDDKMPYTFMWWLDKTRKEYAGTYQPYVKNVQQSSALSVGPELHQQYIESIFHTKAPHKVPENVLPKAAEPFVKRKENPLIERFIIEEPHIHPPSMDKLDTENKAKKSSEDADVLVTETLAKVYLDQMLYHKALDTYKKLVLKFPEKSVYFAAQITEIERKIN